MTDKLLKIVFIEKSETTELKSLNNVFGEITTCYKFVKNELEINELIFNLENNEKLVCRYIDDVLYVEGLRKNWLKIMPLLYILLQKQSNQKKLKMLLIVGRNFHLKKNIALTKKKI